MSGKMNYRAVFGHPALAVADALISMCVVAPLVVGYWRGTWFLLDVTLLPDNVAASCWTSLAIGVSVLLAATWLQQILQKSANIHCCLYFIISRTYTIIFCLGCVNQWRGVWATLDWYTGVGWVSSSVSVAIGAAGLILLRAFRNVLAPPVVLVVDSSESYFTFPTMFRTTGEKSIHARFLDGIFTVGVIGTLIVFVWRGSFHILDKIMFPGNMVWSAWGSTILGYSTTLLTFSLQLPLAAICKRTRGIGRIVITDIFTAIAYIGAVNVWRGLWNLYDIYLLPEDKILSCLLTHAAGLFVLMLFYTSHSIIVRGVYFDAEEPGPAAAVLPCSFLRYFAQRRRQEFTVVPTDEPKKTVKENGHWTSEETDVMIASKPNHVVRFTDSQNKDNAQEETFI